MTSLNDVMTRVVRTLASNDSVSQGAQLLAELDAGGIPGCDAGKLLSMVLTVTSCCVASPRALTPRRPGFRK